MHPTSRRTVNDTLGLVEIIHPITLPGSMQSIPPWKAVPSARLKLDNALSDALIFPMPSSLDSLVDDLDKRQSPQGRFIGSCRQCCPFGVASKVCHRGVVYAQPSK